MACRAVKHCAIVGSAPRARAVRPRPGQAAWQLGENLRACRMRLRRGAGDRVGAGSALAGARPAPPARRLTRRTDVRRPKLQTHLLQRTAVGDLARGGVPRAVDHGARSSWRCRPGSTNRSLRSDLTLCLLVFALTFPGRNRFRDRPLNAAVDIITSWLSLLADPGAVRLRHAQPAALRRRRCCSGGRSSRRCCSGWPSSAAASCCAAWPPAREPAHARWWSAPARWASRWRGPSRPAATSASLPGLLRRPHRRPRGRRRRAAAPGQPAGRWRRYVREHGVHEVYITLPLGSQPRIVELLEQVQGTTASVFFVPDVFGISIIQGRLQDMNGVPVVGLCETPFTGTNRLVKRLSRHRAGLAASWC